MSGGRVPEADVVRVTKKISSQLRQGKWRQALLLFHAASNNFVETNLVSFNVALNALATGSAWMDGLSRLTHVVSTTSAGDSLDQVSFNTVGSSLCGGQWAISLNLLGVACIARVQLDIIGMMAKLGCAFALASLSSLIKANAETEADLFKEVKAMQLALADQKKMLETNTLNMDNFDKSRRLQSTYVTKSAFDAEVTPLLGTYNSFTGALDSAWLCLCGALVMFMHAGFAMLETGSCRAKNASNVLMKNLVNVCVGTLGWWAFGWAFAYGAEAKSDGGNGFIGASGFFGWDFYTRDDSTGAITPVGCDAAGKCQSTMLSWFFQWAFCTAGATIVSGGVAERVKSPTYAAYAFFMTSFIYPVIVAWTWGGGWISTIFDSVGYMDFAGSGIVHLTGGVSALAGTVVLGPRKGRFERPDEFEAHNLPLVVLGTFCLWFGWYGFNPGSTLGMSSGSTGAMAAQVAMNTTISAATGGLCVFLFRAFITGKYDVGGLCNGILAGLVSITAGCGSMECGSACFTGFMGALVYQGASMLLQKLHIDDPVDASPVHGFCGMWGVLAASLFDWGAGMNHYHGWSGFDCMADANGCRQNIGGTGVAANIILILMVIVWAGSFSFLAFFILKKTGLLRIDEETESTGLDIKHHSPPKAYQMASSTGGVAASEHSPPKAYGPV